MSCREGRADPEMRSAKCTFLCRALQSWFEELPYHTEMHVLWPWIESFQDCWWDPECPQLLQMVQSLPGFLNLCLNVCSPRQVLWDVYTEVLEATLPLHRGPTYHKRSVGSLLSLPEVHDQLFSFSHIQRERQLSWHHDVSLSTSSKYAASSLFEMRSRTTVSSANLIIEVELWEDTQSCV